MFRFQGLLLLLISFLLSAASADVKVTPDSIFLSYEKRLVLTYLLAGAGGSPLQQYEIRKRLEKTIRAYIAKPAQIVQVRSYDEYLRSYMGPWPNSFSVESDLSLIENGELRGMIQYEFVDEQGRPNPELAELVREVREQQQELMRNKIGPVSKILGDIVNTILSSPGRLDAEMSKAENMGRWSSLIQMGFQHATGLMQKQLAQIDQVGNQIASTKKLADLDPAMKLFMETVLHKYFNRLKSASKKQMVSRFLGQDLNSTPLEKFEIMLLSAGPIFQKFLQIIASNSRVSPDIRVILKKLESDNHQIPEVLVRNFFEAERHRYNWISYETKALSVGTMAEVHRAKLATPEGPLNVAVRFLKPGIDLRVDEDAAIFMELAVEMDRDPRFEEAGFPKLQPTVRSLIENVRDENNQMTTIRRQQKADVFYRRVMTLKTANYKNELHIRAPKVYMPNENSRLMIQELVSGSKLEAQVEIYKNLIPELKTVIVEALAKMWVEEALFRSGFYHSDLHPGNILVLIQDDRIEVFILDFGMGGIISKDLREQFFLLEMSSRLNRPDQVAETLLKVATTRMNSKEMADFNLKVRKKQQAALLASVEMGAGDWLLWAIKENIEFPEQLVNMNRGLVIINQALSESNSKLTVNDIAEGYTVKYAKQMVSHMRSGDMLKAENLLVLAGLKKAPTSMRSCRQIHSAVSK